jgi:hypothetical protein
MEEAEVEDRNTEQSEQVKVIALRSCSVVLAC